VKSDSIIEHVLPETAVMDDTTADTTQSATPGNPWQPSAKKLA
jgi:hypothetical protein